MGLVIFDCDGVLINSEEVALESDCEFLAQHKLYFTRDEFIEFASGVESQKFLEKLELRCWQTNQRGLPPDFGKILQAHYERDVYPKIRATEDLIPVLAMLREKGQHFCVASNGSLHSTYDKLYMTGLSKWFGQNVFSKDMVPGHPKPDPDLFLHAAAHMGYPIEECTIVEDSVVGVTAGVRADMPVVGFAKGAHRPAHYKDVLRQTGAIQIAHSMIEVKDILERRIAFANLIKTLPQSRSSLLDPAP